MRYRFSVGIPAYKAKFLDRAIKSVLDQTFSDFELIIINDCSPEPLEEIVGRFSDTRIKYSKNGTNVGVENVVDNWNKCLEQASGDFFVLMCDDDMMKPNYLQAFNLLIEKFPDLDVFHCRSVIIDESDLPLRLTYSWPEFESVYENIWHRIKKLRIQYLSDFVYRVDRLRLNNGFYKLPAAWASDDISAYIAAGQKGIAHTQEAVFCYRENSQSLSSTSSKILKMSAILLEEKWLTEFLKEKPNNEQDAIFHSNIKAELRRFIQKNKVRVIANSLKQDGLFAAFKWFSLRRKYSISITDLILAVLEALKRSRMRKNYF